MNLRGNSIVTDGRTDGRRRTTTHFKSFLSYEHHPKIEIVQIHSCCIVNPFFVGGLLMGRRSLTPVLKLRRCHNIIISREKKDSTTTDEQTQRHKRRPWRRSLPSQYPPLGHHRRRPRWFRCRRRRRVLLCPCPALVKKITIPSPRRRRRRRQRRQRRRRRRRQ